MLGAADNIKLSNKYFSSILQLKSLENRLAKDEDFGEKYKTTIREDLNEGYVIEVPDAHKVEKRSDKEWYLPHHPVLNLNKPGKVRTVHNGAAKFHGASINKSLLTGPKPYLRTSSFPATSICCLCRHRGNISTDWYTAI